jgi:hypothetical protein
LIQFNFLFSDWCKQILTDSGALLYGRCHKAEFLKFVGPIRPREQKIMRSANNVGNAGPHVRQTFLNDVFTFLTEVGNAGRIVNTGTSSVNSEFVTALNTWYFICFWSILLVTVMKINIFEYIVMRKMTFSSEKPPKN